jgi:RND family efflux transporter MFP subunit
MGSSHSMQCSRARPRARFGWSIVLLGSTLWFTPGCSNKGQGSAHAAEVGAKGERTTPRPVRLVAVAQRDLARSLVVTGSLAADERVTVSTKVEGRLSAVNVDLGSKLAQGDSVAQLETTDYRLRVEQAEALLSQARARLGLDAQGTDSQVEIDQTSLVKEAQATLQEATANLERARSLVEKRLIARSEFDTASATFVRAETAVENAREEIRNRIALLRQRRSEVELAKKQLADTTVRSPLSGMVEAKQASVGEYLPVGSPIATVVRIDPLRLRAEVPERDAASVRVDQRVRFVIDGQTGAFEGRVARLSPILAEQSRTLAVEAEIPNSGSLRPGSFARAEIVLDGAAPALVVPPPSVVTFAGIDKVLGVDAGKVVEKRIVTGRKGPDFVEVLDGLLAGESVIAEPGNLQQGALVSVLER